MTHPSSAEPTVRQERTPSTVDLFMFSAASWLTHRIHYDADYARSEGYQRPVVQGPMQGAYLSQLLFRFAQQNRGRLRDMTYRHEGIALAGQPLVVEARVTQLVPRGSDSLAELALRITDDGGTVLTSGEATVWLPGSPTLTDLALPGPEA
jgi:hydroxyacyl-ACP dehydratase HTD2-like protein with hotdog domain